MDFTKTIEEDIAIIKWDCKEKSMNTMSIEGMETFGGLVIDAIENKAIKGIIITSGKKDFSGGMDLSTLESLKHNTGENPASGIFGFQMFPFHLYFILNTSCYKWIQKISNAGERRTKMAGRLRIGQ